MHLLLITNTPLHPNTGGLERTTLNLFDYLMSHSDIKCFVSCPESTLTDNRITIIKKIITNAEDIRSVIDNYKIDCILLPYGPWYTILAHEAVQGRNCRIISALHARPGSGDKAKLSDTFFEYKISKGKHKLLRLKELTKQLLLNKKYINSSKKFYNLAYAYSDYYVLLSESYISEFRDYAGLSEISKLKAIPNALSFSSFADQLLIQKKEKSILVVARLFEPNKRVSYALRIWQKIQHQYPDWRLDIIGAGPHREYYESMILELSLERANLLGQQDSEPFYERSSILLMASTYEGFPMTLIEATQKGTVPIAMDTFGAIHDIIKNGINGYIVDDNNLDAMQERLELLIKDEALRLRLAANAVKDSHRFSMDIIGKEWLKLFYTII